MVTVLWIGAKSIVNGSLSILALLVVSAILWRVLATPSMSILEISIPKSLTELGYTSTEISSELKGDILGIIQDAHSHKGVEEVVTQFESADFTIPGVGLSLFTIEDTLRRLFSFAHYWQVSGHITDDKGEYILHLRIWDGLNNKIFDYSAAGRKEVPILMTDAAQAVVGQIDPYILATSFLQTDSNRSEDLARKIIDSPQSDRSTIAWAHILLSNIYGRRHSYDRALKEDDAALDIDKNMTAAHLAKGVDVLSNNCNNDECVEISINETKLVLKLDPRNAAAYANIGLAETMKAFRTRSSYAKPNYGDAESDFRRALLLDNQIPMPHLNLGLIFIQEARLSEAEDQIKNYLMLVPGDVSNRERLGLVFEMDDKYDEASEQYYRVLLADPFHLSTLERVCIVLKMQGYIDDYRNENKSIAVLRDMQAGAGN
jgi:tetratricopeptide (TPR) repeat protein